MKVLASAVRRAVFVIWRRRVRAAFERSDPCALFGLDLIIAPGVLHPRHFASSRILARHVGGLDLRGLRVADMGTGSGLLGLLAARAGAHVTAVDINPTAIACAKENARRNGLDSRMNVVLSDVFEGIPSEPCFDLVMTNPPFYPRDPRDMAEHAFAAGAGHAFFAKLTNALPGRLSDSGMVLLIHSSDTDFGPISAMFEASRMIGRDVVKKRAFLETLTVKEYRQANALRKN